jgi:hypothetical protein
MLYGGTVWNVPPSSYPHGVQDQWSWCTRCSGLFYGGEVSSSYCPAISPQGPHLKGSRDYEMAFGPASEWTPTPVQAGWRFCGQCKGLFWSGQGGLCPGTNNMGFPHRAGASTNYGLVYASR